jgi:hypothetical protein
MWYLQLKTVSVFQQLSLASLHISVSMKVMGINFVKICSPITRSQINMTSPYGTSAKQQNTGILTICCTKGLVLVRWD